MCSRHPWLTGGSEGTRLAQGFWEGPRELPAVSCPLSELAAPVPPQSFLCPAWPHRKLWEDRPRSCVPQLLPVSSMSQDCFRSWGESGPQESRSQPRSFWNWHFTGGGGMANPHVLHCASVSVSARKFKGTLAAHISYPLDRAPADQYF